MFKRSLLFTYSPPINFFKLHKFSLFLSVASVFYFIPCFLAFGWLLAKEDFLYEFKHVIESVTIKVIDADLHSFILKVRHGRLSDKLNVLHHLCQTFI